MAAFSIVGRLDVRSVGLRDSNPYLRNYIRCSEPCMSAVLECLESSPLPCFGYTIELLAVEPLAWHVEPGVAHESVASLMHPLCRLRGGSRRARHLLTWAGVSTSRPRRLNKEGRSEDRPENLDSNAQARPRLH